MVMSREAPLVIVAMVVAISLVFGVWRVRADDLENALEGRLTVWVRPRDNHPFYVRHCTLAKGGCRARIRALAKLFNDVAARKALDPTLLAAVAVKESGLNPKARGSYGEEGVLQINPRNKHARKLRRTGDGAPTLESMVEVGAEILRACIDKCGSIEAGLGAYKTGRCDPSLPYVRRVLEERGRLTSRTFSHNAGLPLFEVR